MFKYIVTLLMLFFTQSIFAFTLISSSNSSQMGWSNPDITLLVNTANCPAGMDIPSIINDAASAWNNVPTSAVHVSYGGATTSTAYSAPTTVYCETNFQAVAGADDDSVPGAASVQMVNGQIVTGILYLNVSAGAANIANFDGTELKIILAHEIGHILGLGHSASPNALMYYSAGSKTDFNLSQDDIDGVSYLYPSNELSDNKFAGCGIVRSPKPPNSKNLMLLGFLFLLPLFAALNLRSRKNFIPRF